MAWKWGLVWVCHNWQCEAISVEIVGKSNCEYWRIWADLLWLVKTSNRHHTKGGTRDEKGLCELCEYERDDQFVYVSVSKLSQ